MKNKLKNNKNVLIHKYLNVIKKLKLNKYVSITWTTYNIGRGLCKSFIYMYISLMHLLM